MKKSFILNFNTIKLIFLPLHRIIQNILWNLYVSVFIPNHVLIKILLPELFIKNSPSILIYSFNIFMSCFRLKTSNYITKHMFIVWATFIHLLNIYSCFINILFINSKIVFLHIITVFVCIRIPTRSIPTNRAIT